MVQTQVEYKALFANFEEGSYYVYGMQGVQVIFQRNIKYIQDKQCNIILFATCVQLANFSIHPKTINIKNQRS